MHRRIFNPGGTSSAQLVPVCGQVFRVRTTKFRLRHRGEPERLSAVYPSHRRILIQQDIDPGARMGVTALAVSQAWNETAGLRPVVTSVS